RASALGARRGARPGLQQPVGPRGRRTLTRDAGGTADRREAAMIRVLPPGPFPAPGGTPNGAVDLAWRVADTRYTGSWLGGPGRAALSERLREALRAGDLAEASAILDD